MRLGGSIRRRRGAGGRKRGEGRSAPARLGRLGLLTLGVGVVAFGIGYLFATRLLFPAPPPPGDLVEVPDLLGLRLEAARERILEAGLDPGPVEGLRHPAQDSGRVVGQGPLSGQLAPPGTRVRMTVSLGPQREVVPDVVDLRGDRARRLLEATGFRVMVDSVESELPAGRVVAVDPEVGTELPVPGDVRLTLSLGPPRIPMPYLLGMPQRDAIDSLVTLGLEVAAVDTVFRFGRDRGLVVEQAPTADSLLERGAAVRLSVGRSGGP